MVAGTLHAAGREVAAGGELNADLARAVVGIYRRFTGKGPERCQAFFHDATAVIVLRHVLSPGERSLVEHRRLPAAQLTRRELQAAMREELVAAIEVTTGSRVTAALGDTDVGADTAVEVFILDRPVSAYR